MENKLDPQPTPQRKAGRRARKPSVEEKIPPWLENYKGPMTSHNLEPEDFVWKGDDGSLDPDEFLESVGYEFKGPLWILLRAIVAANPGDGKSEPEERIAVAEAALLGRTRKAGNREIEDEARLIEIGKRYFAKWLVEDEIAVGPIVKEVLDDPRFAPKQEGAPESVVRRLQRKFKRDRNRILAPATVELRWDTPQYYKRILRIISELRALGVAIDEAVVRGRLRLGEPKTAD